MRGGQITSRQVVTPHGPVYQVRVDPDATLASAPRNGHNRHGDAMAAVPPPLADLVGLVERLHRENVELTGMVGSLQQRLIFADEQIRTGGPARADPRRNRTRPARSRGICGDGPTIHPDKTHVVAALAPCVASTIGGHDGRHATQAPAAVESEPDDLRRTRRLTVVHGCAPVTARPGRALVPGRWFRPRPSSSGVVVSTGARKLLAAQCSLSTTRSER